MRKKIIGVVDAKSSRFGSRIPPSPEIMVCVVYSEDGCTAKSGTTLGTGTGLMQYIDEDGEIATYETHGEDTIEVVFFNSTTNVLDPGYYQLKREEISGKFLVDVAECN